MKNFRVFLIILILGLFGAGIGIYIYQQTPSASTQPITESPTKVRIQGTTTCLPHRDTSGPQTMECLYGLQGEDGRYYGLRSNDPDPLAIASIPTGKTVIIEGTLQPVKNDRYAIVGIIEIESIQK